MLITWSTVLLLERIPNDDIENNYTYNESFFSSFFFVKIIIMSCNAEKVCGLYLGW